MSYAWSKVKVNTTLSYNQWSLVYQTSHLQLWSTGTLIADKLTHLYAWGCARPARSGIRISCRTTGTGTDPSPSDCPPTIIRYSFSLVTVLSSNENLFFCQTVRQIESACKTSYAVCRLEFANREYASVHVRSLYGTFGSTVSTSMPGWRNS